MIDVKHLSIDGILHDITFHIAPGERVGIIGESGSGKSVTALSLSLIHISEPTRPAA